MDRKHETAYFGGGCFWCTEAFFRRLKGVFAVISGYSGGETEHPTYTQVSAGTTGHAEVVKVEFDPQEISYNTLLEVFFTLHDPTTRNRQGADTGSQYRSIILYTDKAQKQAAEKYIDRLNGTGQKQVVTEVVPFTVFYEAENNHRDYYDKNSSAPYCRLVITPKISKLFNRFPDVVKD